MTVLHSIPHVSSITECSMGSFTVEDIYPLLEALSTKWRGVKFGTDSNIFHRRYFIYFEGDDYARGIVHTTDDKKGKTLYCVAAPSIMNKRYKDSTYTHNMLSSISISTAVKNIMKYFTPVPLHKIVRKFKYDISSPFTDMKRRLEIEHRSLCNRVAFDRLLIDELVDMHKAGHVFRSSKLTEMMPELVEARTKFEEFKDNTDVGMVFVHLHVDGAVSLIRIPSDSIGMSTEKYVNDHLCKLNNSSELGEDMQGKISLLQMNNQTGEYVLGVGTMMSKHMWVIHGEY